jgi:predicted transcriptional regulator
VKLFEARLERMRVILNDLSRSPLSYTALGRRFVQKTSCSFLTFGATFRFLVEDGCVEKCGVEYRAPYHITKKGEAFLAWRAQE